MANQAQDTWVDVKQPAQADNEWQDVRQPADANLQQNASNLFASQHPYLKTLQDTVNQGIVNPVVQTANALSPVVRGIAKDVGANPGGQNIQGPDMSQAPMAAKVLGDVASGAGQGVAASAIGGGNPIIGMGAMGALSAQGNNQNPLFGAVSGIGQGAVQSLAGLGGSKIFQGIAKPLSSAVSNISSDAAKWITKYAPNIGTALGMGTAGATMAPSGQKIEGAATGATFGSINPVGGPKFITSDEYNNKYLPDAGNQIVKVLNPGKNVYTNFNNNGNDVDEASQTIAHNRIIIGKTADGKIDTTDGQQQLLDSTKPYAQQLQQMLGTDKSTQFDLEDIRKQAKDALLGHPDFQNGKAYAAGSKEIDNQIDSEIAMPGRGRYINGQTLDDIKGGWWKVRYDQNNQSAKPVGGLLGNIAKNTIEQAYPNQPIQQTNAEQGKLLNAYHLLDMTNGNVIKGGKLGNHFSGIAGGIIGNAVGKSIPIPVLGEAIGTGAGIMAGEGFGKYTNDPTRITTNIAKNLDNLKIVNPSGYNQGSSTRKGTVTPEVINTPNPRNIPTPQDLGLPMSPVAGTLGYDRVGDYGASRMAAEQPGMVTPVSRPSGMPINQPPNPGALGLPRGVQNTNTGNIPEMTSGKRPFGQQQPFYTQGSNELRGPSASSMNPINIPPKTSQSNGPLQPNPRAQVDMSKGGMAQTAGAPIPQQPIGQRIPQGNVMRGSMNPLSNLTPEQLKAVEKNVKLTKNQIDREKIIRS